MATKRISRPHHAGNTATYVDRDGYVWERTAEQHPNGKRKYRLQHRLIVEARIGRRLASNQLVHHINGDRADNRTRNLTIVDRAAHTRHHNAEKRQPNYKPRPHRKLSDVEKQQRREAGRRYRAKNHERLLKLWRELAAKARTADPEGCRQRVRRWKRRNADKVGKLGVTARTAKAAFMHEYMKTYGPKYRARKTLLQRLRRAAKRAQAAETAQNTNT